MAGRAGDRDIAVNAAGEQVEGARPGDVDVAADSRKADHAPVTGRHRHIAIAAAGGAAGLRRWLGGRRRGACAVAGLTQARSAAVPIAPAMRITRARASRWTRHERVARPPLAAKSHCADSRVIGLGRAGPEMGGRSDQTSAVPPSRIRACIDYSSSICAAPRRRSPRLPAAAGYVRSGLGCSSVSTKRASSDCAIATTGDSEPRRLRPLERMTHAGGGPPARRTGGRARVVILQSCSESDGQDATVRRPAEAHRSPPAQSRAPP